MWERLFEFMRQVLTLTENQRRQEDEIHELQRQLNDLSQTSAEEIRILRSQMERLASELQHTREREDSERRILKLEMENYLLRQERGLPPAKPETPADPEANNQKDDSEGSVE